MVLAVAIATLVVSTGITSSLFSVLYNKLADLTLEKIGKNDDVADKLQKLARTLLKIESLVDDMENKQTNSNFCEMLIEHVKSALFDAEDLLDKIDFGKLEFKTAILSVKSEGEVAVIRMLERVEDLVKEMEGYLLSEINKKRSPPQSLDVNPRTSSLVDKLSVFGRDNEKEKMVEMLLAQRTENVSVIPIWGMGGTGKTTLAQLVYNDQAVVRNFKLRMWVCFSSLDTDLVTVTKSIYESATNEVLELPNLDAVQVALQEKMRRKKFLLVLDGMWNENPAFWDALKLPFRFAAPGSNIVVTTRSKIVSLIVSTGQRYDLHTLSGDSGDEACRDIIKQSFGGNLDGHGDLWNIAKKCEGLPLAAKVIGRVLRFKLGTKEWDHILNYELWDFPEDYKSQIYPVLKVSYDHLPSNLKRCFGYCSIFPHKFQFEEDDLIQLWAAEGFIQPQRTRSVQGIGREYIDFLLSRSLFQVSPNDADRQTEAEPHGGQLLSIPGAALPRSLKHLSISSQLCTRLPSLGQLPVLKDLVIGKMGTLTNVDRQFCRLAGSFPSLETLTFCDMPELSIGSGINNLDMPRLIELRIDSCPNLVSLPSVHHLTSLETLDINDCPQLPSIPGEGLPRSLTHLSISDSDSLKEWCKGRDGDDWSKIRWILEIVIDGDEIPMDGRGN
ncbi:hypothetical protein C1H46_028748 [Malus baccata]|uniref:NB-ARC domain-containing protein n=1 Tax=Malus baccata TaxID=106549 RepID=A0A540LGU5_MALBA|nr:hypothetical protein C1H46_028748 [Malus baccata]